MINCFGVDCRCAATPGYHFMYMLGSYYPQVNITRVIISRCSPNAEGYGPIYMTGSSAASLTYIFRMGMFQTSRRVVVVQRTGLGLIILLP